MNPYEIALLQLQAQESPADYKGTMQPSHWRKPSKMGQALANAFQQYDNNNALAKQQIIDTMHTVAPVTRPVEKEEWKQAIRNPQMPSEAEQEQMLRSAMNMIPVAGMTLNKAHAIAQRNAALPVAEGGLGLHANNTAAERAKAMGGIDVYHGTASDIQQIDPRLFGTSTGAESAKRGFWTVDNPSTANGYANYAANDVPVKRLLKEADKFEKKGNWDAYDDAVGRAEALEAKFADNPANGQNIMPLTIIPKKKIYMDAAGQEFTDLEGGVNRFLADAKRSGADVAEIQNLSDDVAFNGRPANHYAVLNPSSIRSRYAAFDPKRSGEADIMASLAAIFGTGYFANKNSD